MVDPAHSATLRDVAEGEQKIEFRFSPSSLLILCLFIQGWFVILHLHLAEHTNPGVAILGQSFDLMRESSLPTSYAFLQALAVALVAGLIVYVLRKQGVPASHRSCWILAAILFAVIAIDDAAGFHERIGSITSLGLMNEIGYPSYPWHVTIAPILGGCLLLVIYMLWGVLKGVGGARAMLMAGLACYGLSQGIDFFEGLDRMAKVDIGGLVGLIPQAMLVEEVLEMVGTAFFLYAFSAYLKQRLTGRPMELLEDEELELEVAADVAPPALAVPKNV